MVASNVEVAAAPDPEVHAVAKRRQYSAEYKPAVLAQADLMDRISEISALVRPSDTRLRISSSRPLRAPDLDADCLWTALEPGDPSVSGVDLGDDRVDEEAEALDAVSFHDRVRIQRQVQAVKPVAQVVDAVHQPRLHSKPGLVGGHCIGVDPYYLSHKTETLGYYPLVIIAGRRINDRMGKFVGEQTVKQMIAAGSYVNGAKVKFLGLTFKENCPDLRNSKVVDIIRELHCDSIEVFVHDTQGDPAEAMSEYGVRLLAWPDLPRAAASATWPLLRNLDSRRPRNPRLGGVFFWAPHVEDRIEPGKAVRNTRYGVGLRFLLRRVAVARPAA